MGEEKKRGGREEKTLEKKNYIKRGQGKENKEEKKKTQNKNL
jgi:hypothetical protein